jgi:hypothetical protein
MLDIEKSFVRTGELIVQRIFFIALFFYHTLMF